MSIFGICPTKCKTAYNDCTSCTPIPEEIFYNPRFTTYFADYPPELGTISNLNHYNILGAILRRGEFSPEYSGTSSSPPVGTGWQAFAHIPIRWNGPSAEFKVELNIVLGRQQFQQVDAELFMKINGTEVPGLNTTASLSRAPTGFHGTTTMNLVGFVTLNTGDELEPLMKRIGFNEASNTDINVYSSTVNISSLRNEKLAITIFA